MDFLASGIQFPKKKIKSIDVSYFKSISSLTNGGLISNGERLKSELKSASIPYLERFFPSPFVKLR
ncbi:hypothetical protein DLM78_23125 [Leptospira stimsonii]|uniref:Uncharacterized protein n=1 Tax=Leptospira stimsonii TaxID=2202203 RepID=A0A8B3CIS1_9LEPT|nr:hypothetical protein DLM78_23125 [Leptospira stimsonii]